MYAQDIGVAEMSKSSYVNYAIENEGSKTSYVNYKNKPKKRYNFKKRNIIITGYELDKEFLAIVKN